MKLPAIDSLDVNGKRVLVRVDFNVPLKAGQVTDDMRIRAALPTIQHLLDRGATVICCSHLGRPKGKVDPQFSLEPAARALADLLQKPVRLTEAANGPPEDLEGMERGDVALLQNLRYDPREEANDPEFSAELAALADVYVCDAFGAVHRAHASVAGVPKLLPSAAGALLHKEVDVLSRLLGGPEQPFVVILGGSKVSDKLGIVKNLLGKADSILIGGAMANTFLAADGHDIGKSRIEAERLDEVKQILAEAKEVGVQIGLPNDVVVATEFAENAPASAVDVDRIPPDSMALDIGPNTVYSFSEWIRVAKTVLWNGPMGVFEWENFAAGTKEVAKLVAEAEAFTVVGGGDSAAALAMFGLEGNVNHLSTGGGASLEFLEGRPLPGLEALNKGGGE
ncbi:MAG: phosphoglycerate kinase [Actinobacteria bacterium]|nr:phosphoglycerate kinase [Actinomycetota bacterium]